MEMHAVRAEKLYLIPENTFCVEQLVSWYINHLGHTFSYCPGKKTFTPSCLVANEGQHMFGPCLCPLVTVASALPFKQASHMKATISYDSETDVRWIRLKQNYVFVVDFSSSILNANTDGKCYLSDALTLLELMIRQLIGARSASLPGTQFRLRTLSSVITVIVVLPNLRCYTLLAGWNANLSELRGKMRIISRLLVKIERELIHIYSAETKSNPQVNGSTSNSLTDLLKHGIMAATSLNVNNDPCSMLIITDGCLSICDVEILDRSLTHLRSEGIRCSFVIINKMFPLPVPTTPNSVEGSALSYATNMNICIPQLDLCALLAHSTNGFCINTGNGEIFAQSHGFWNDLLELLISTPLLFKHDIIDGNLDWVPAGTLETQRRLVRASLPTVLATRLRDGYKLSKVNVLKDASGAVHRESEGPLTNFGRENELDDADQTACFSGSLIHIELTMLWKVGITFFIHIRGLWPDVYQSTGANKRILGLIDGSTEGSFPLHVKNQSKADGWTRNFRVCQVSFSISANYSFLHEVTCKRKLPIQNIHRASTISLFVMYHRHLSLTDQQIEHVFKFWGSEAVSKGPEQLPNGLSSVFALIPDSAGKQVVVPSLLAHRLSASHDGTTPIASTKSQFFHFWRLFIERDLLEFYRWLQIHNIYGILEHDSPLPVYLHLPPGMESYTASVACRQSLDRLHAFLSRWSSFTLLDGIVYVRLLIVDEEETVSVPGCVSNTSILRETPSSSSAGDVGFTGMAARDTQLDRSLFFCVIRVELKTPEFRLRIGFVIGTPPPLQDEIVLQLREQIMALRFPPRGRQAIPRSRHKSGAPLTNSECNNVPPLQRSWGDTPCCNIFDNRLERLVVNTGVWTKRFFTGCRPSLSRGFLSGDLHNEAVIAQRLTEQFEDSCSVGSTPRPGLELYLLGQHLHHNSKVWVIQPPDFSSDALRLLFSSLLNLRLQEGFHIVRSGPQTGFVSLATEIKLASPSKEKEIPCLVQYQLYPLGDARLSDPDTVLSSSFSPLDSNLKKAITHVITEQRKACSEPNPTCSIFNLTRTTNDRLTHPFRFVQVVTELWIQPLEGHVVPYRAETQNWEGACFSELAQRIFDVDRRCVVAYVTLERLSAMLRSPTSMQQAINVGTNASTAYAKVDSLLGSLAPEASIEWARTCLPHLSSLSPFMVLIYSFQNTEQIKLPSTPNDILLSHLCASLLENHGTREIHMTSEDSVQYTAQLCKQLEVDSLLTADELPKWRCFVIPGSLDSEAEQEFVFSSDFNSNPMVTIIFLPKSFKDASNLILTQALKKSASLKIDSWDFVYLPVFVYSCSRVYLSYLIDDRWTYKVPPVIFFDLTYHISEFASPSVHSEGFSQVTIPSIPPESFLSAGRQNLRLTQELNSLWTSLAQTAHFLSRMHLDAFVFSVYHCLNSRCSVSKGDMDYVLLNTQLLVPSQPLRLDVTPFSLLTCEHWMTAVSQYLRGSCHDGDSSLGNSLLMALLGGETGLLESEPELHIPLSAGCDESRSSCSSCMSECARFQHLMKHYMVELNGYDGLFILSRDHKVGSHGIDPPLGDQPVGVNSAIVADALPEIAHLSDPSHSMDSDNSADSGSYMRTPAGSTRHKGVDLRRKHAARISETDFLVRTINQWFVTACETGQEGPLFIRISGTICYRDQSISVPIVDGLPVFCFKQLTNLFTKLAGDERSSDRLSLGLSTFKFELKLALLYWPRYSVRKWFSQSNRSNSASEDHKSAHRAESTGCANTYLTSLAMEDAARTVFSWSTQTELSPLSTHQKGSLCRFACCLTWQMANDIVCGLRSLSPILVPSIEFVLRHIEDTEKLCLTPLFQEYRLISVDDSVAHTDYSDSPSHAEDKMSSQADVGTKVQRGPMINSVSAGFREPSQLIKVERIRLDFVSFSLEIFSYFTRQFEKICFGPVQACLEYLDGYYYLRSIEVHASNVTQTKPDFNDSLPITDVSVSKKSPIHKTLDANHCSLSQSVLSGRPSIHACSETLVSCLPRASFGFESNMWIRGKDSTTRNRYPNKLSSHATHCDHLENSSTGGHRGHTNRSHVPTSLTYKVDSSDLSDKYENMESESCPARLFCHALPDQTNENGIFFTKLQSKRKSTVEYGINQSRVSVVEQYKMPPYWLIFRVCTNSVSLFFHHHGTSQTGDHGHMDETIRDSPKPCCASSIAPFVCDHCNTFQFAIRSIHAVMRLVNQRILLNKLRNERKCDPLLMEVSNDGRSKQQAPPTRRGFRSLTNERRSKHSSAMRLGMERSPVASAVTRHTHESHHVDTSLTEQSDRELEGPVHPARHSQDKKNHASTTSSAPHRTSLRSSSCLSSNWCPGYFACPVQMVSYLRLHPRILAAIAHVGQVDRDRRIVAALRCLLEKPAIAERSDMFFLIDGPPEGVSTEPKTSVTNFTTQMTSTTKSVSTLDEVPVFYMILKEGTAQSFTTDSIVGDLSMMGDTNMILNDLHRSDVNDTKSSERITSDTKVPVSSTQSTHPSSHGRNTGDLLLQITLHGIDTPSRHLCSFVRRMLQQLLDDLILQHFSDSLSRNAISRLSVEDLNFLSKSLAPQRECLIALPQFLCSPTMLCPGVPYGSGQLTLAFCHYLKQNLSLFLTAVKLDRSETPDKCRELVELFLYNRPRAQGVAKPGVATLSFRLLSYRRDNPLSTDLHSYVVTDWTLPYEHGSGPNGFEPPSFDQLQQAVRDVCEFDRTEICETNKYTAPRLILSVRIWQRGDADLSGLQQRVQTAVSHSLYDIITEFFVLTSPIKLHGTAVGASQVARATDSVAREANPPIQINPYLTAVVLPWLGLGRLLDNPLVLKTEVNLSSGILIDQFIADFLRPFNSNLSASSLTIDGGEPIQTSTSINRQAPSVNVTPVGTGTTVPECIPNRMFFYVFTKQDRQEASSYWLKQSGRFRRQTTEPISRPGLTQDYLLVGRDVTAWRRLLQRAESVTRGSNTVDFKDSLAHEAAVDRSRSDRLTSPVLDFDVLLRMQPLQITLLVPIKTANPQHPDSFTSVVDQQTNRSILDEVNTSSRVNTGNCFSTINASGFGPELSAPGTPAACRFPEFCPIKFAPPMSTLQPALLVPSNISPRVSNVTAPGGPLLQQLQQQQQRQPPQQQQSQPAIAVSDAVDSPPINSSGDRAAPFVVQVPRQAFCMIQLTGRRVTLFTYNWSKEEADRLSCRLTSLADWYNRRLQLLQSLSAQKLGLFHDLDDPLVRWCAGHAGELISNPCPLDSLTHPDSILTGSTSRGPQATPVSSVGVGSQSGGSSTGLRVYASAAVTVGSNVAGGSSGGSAARRRHPTSSGDFVPTASHPSQTHASSPPTSFLHSATLLSESNSGKAVTNFLRLFQDCSRIPQLKPPGDSEISSVDLVFRHGLQALAAVDFDRRRAQRLEMLTLPFRAWQESRKRRLAGENVIERLASTKTTISTETTSRLSGPRKLAFGISDAEAALASEPASKQLKRFSAIRQACRHLHTICTPILFCTRIRAQAVQLTQSELSVLAKVAEACYQWQQESIRSAKGEEKPVGQQSASDPPTAKTSVSSADQPSTSKLRDLLVNPRAPVSGVHRVQSCVFGSTQHNPTHSSACLSRASVAGLHHSASPWLNWSRSTLLDVLPGLGTSDALHPVCDPPLSGINHGPDTDSSLSKSWERRVCSAFLAQYAQYIQSEVGFRSVMSTDLLTARSNGNNTHAGQTTNRSNYCSYALFHRAIHLAGVHIMEVFVRNGHVYVRLGTIELSRFSRHASRALISGPFTAEVITQAAASAAASVASVIRDAASGGPDTAQASPSLPVTTSATDSHRFQRSKYATGFSWDESSRLCDYMHINSFSYDYYLRVIQDYLSHQHSRRKPSAEATRRPMHGRSQRSSYTDLLGYPDYPVTDFLADLCYLAPNPPVFSRGCLRSFQLSCPVGVCLRPDQVFHHLIEEHPNYEIQIIRMDRTVPGFEPGFETKKVNPSYTFAILVQHLMEPAQAISGGRQSLTRQSSHPDLKGNKVKPALLQSKSLISSRLRQVPLVNSQDADEDGDQRQDDASNGGDPMLGGWFPRLPCSITACVVVNERSTNALLSQTTSSPGTVSNLCLNVYLFATDPKNIFPKSRLASVHERPYSRFKSPVEWPAVAPCLRLDSPHPVVPRSCSIEDAEALAVLNVSFSGLYRDRHMSFATTADTTEKPYTHNVYVPPSGDLRWQVTYLGMWPSHQLRVQQSLESAQSAIGSRITSLIERSGLDCHKNLLWYRLFDMHHHLDALKLTKRLPPNSDVPLTPNEGCQSVAEHQILSAKEIEDLVQSAPFQLDVLTLDDRLRSTVQIGARYFSQVKDLMNAEFVRTQLQQAQMDQVAQVVAHPVAFTFMFHHTPENPTDPNPAWSTHHMVLLSPAFTEGFVLLTWSQRIAVCIESEQGLPHGFCNHQPQQNYRDFKLRAVFRTAGDPMNPGSMRRLLDSGQQIQGLFFERSPLAQLVTNFVETMNFCIWRGLHTS